MARHDGKFYAYFDYTSLVPAGDVSEEFWTALARVPEYEAEITVDYYSKGRKGVTTAPPEYCYPDEDAEVELSMTKNGLAKKVYCHALEYFPNEFFYMADTINDMAVMFHAVTLRASDELLRIEEEVIDTYEIEEDE